MTSTSYEDSLSRIKHNIAHVQDAIKEILLVKTKLQQHSVEAKIEIHSSISRQLEALRSREVWLLDQVDAIKHIKEGILDDHLCQMQHELGAAKKLLTISGASQSKEFSKQLMTTNTNLEQLSLEPKEDGTIHYTADRDCLREAIYAFGHLETNKRCIIDTAQAYKKVCLSDIREVDHGELYRSLTKLKEKKENDAVIVQPMEIHDWLIKTPTNTPAEPHGELLFPPFNRHESPAEWLQKSSAPPSIKCCVKDDLELDDYDMVRDCDGPSFEMISAPQRDTHLHADVSHHFDEILTSPTKDWLLNPERIRLEWQMGASYPFAVMKYFRDISNDARVWLAGYEERKKLEDIEENQKDVILTCTNQCAFAPTFEHVQSIEIENLDHLMCMKPTAGKSSSTWLKQVKNDDEILPPIESVCHANELCESFSDCICDTNCCMVRKESNPDSSMSMKNKSHWLVTSGSKNASATTSQFPYFQRITTDDDIDWLLANDSHEQQSLVEDMEMHLCKDSHWLFDAQDTQEMSGSEVQRTWLRGEECDTNSSPKSEVWETVQKHHLCYKDTDWFQGQKDSHPIPTEILHGNSQQCNAWKVFADHHSKFSESDWLLNMEKTDDSNEMTNQTPGCDAHAEAEKCIKWCISERQPEWQVLEKHCEQVVASHWIPDKVCGIISQMDGIHLEAPPTKWLLSTHSENALIDRLVPECGETTDQFPCFSLHHAPVVTWLKK